LEICLSWGTWQWGLYRRDNYSNCIRDSQVSRNCKLPTRSSIFCLPLQVRNELPSTLKAYRYQQPRRPCGPANLFRKMTKEIILCGVNYNEWFFPRDHLYFLLCEEDSSTLSHFLLLLRGYTCKCLGSRNKLTMPIAIYIPATITILNAACTPIQPNYSNHKFSPSFFFFFLLTLTGSLQLQSLQWSRSLHLLVFWILFENVMSLRRTKAAIIGLLEANCVNEWVVTEKLGNTVRQKNTFKASKQVLCF
jgi:beta-mannan synthase